MTGDSIIPNLGELKLAEQEEGLENPLKQAAKVCHDKKDSDSDLSTDSEEGDINDGKNCGAVDQRNKVEAPVELKGEV